MQDDFEKRVQQKMEELKLTPSAPVWEKIELQLKPEQRRRRAIAWFFVAALLLGGGWWLTQKPADRLSTRDLGSAEKTATAAPLEKQQPTKRQPAVELSRTKSDTTNAVARKSDRIAPQESIGSRSALPLTTTRKMPVDDPKQRVFFPTITPKKAIAAASNRLSATTSKPSSKPMEEDLLNDQKQEALTSQTAIVPTDQVSTSTDSSKEVKPAAIESKTNAPADSSTRKVKVAAAGKGWKKQVWVQAGISRLSAGLITGYQSRFDRAAYSSNTGSNSLDSRPTAYKAGFSYGAGVGLSKEIKKRVSVTVGLQYAYYSVSSQVGAFKRIDTLIAYSGTVLNVGGYYDKSLADDFTTHYHLLELPVSAAWQVSEAFPLQLSLGASYGRLLKTNALTQIGSSNSYYYNDGNNHRSFVNLLSGVQYRVVNKRGLSLSAGPQVQYAVTTLQKQVAGQAPHLFSAAIRIGLSF